MNMKKNNWNDLNWRKIYAFVSKLQSELVAAYRNKDWEKIHFIQKQLIKSITLDVLCVTKL